MIFAAIFNIILAIISFLFNLLPTYQGGGIPGIANTSFLTITGYMAAFDTFLPIHELLYAVDWVLTAVAVFYGVKVIIWILVATRILSPGARIKINYMDHNPTNWDGL